MATSKSNRTRGESGELRIIAGQWRSRKIRFPSNPGVRPTPNRIRETLFNWLQPWIPGASCLDLFAGSGALGVEALSRGASDVLLVERDRVVAAALRANLVMLKAVHAEVIETDSMSFLETGPSRPFDIVFLDPPFHEPLQSHGHLARCCQLLESRGWVKPGGHVYLEAPAKTTPPLPSGWSLERSKQAGRVGYHLAMRPRPGL